MAKNPNTFKGSEGRLFLQSSATPAQTIDYHGRVSVAEVPIPRGERTPVRRPSDKKRGKFEVVDYTISQPDEPSTTYTLDLDRYMRDVWIDLSEQDCAFNVQVHIGKCTRPDDPLGWDSILLHRNVRISEAGLPALAPMTEDDDQISQVTLSAQLQEVIKIRKLVFGEQAPSVVLAPVVDSVIYDASSCGDCGEIVKACSRIYSLTQANAGSPGLSSQIVYTLDGGLNWLSDDIDSLGGQSGVRLALIGNYLVVLSTAGNGHHFARRSDVDDAVSDWAGVSGTGGGYVTSKAPVALWSKTPGLTFVVGQGGYVYKMSDPTRAVTVLNAGITTVQNLNEVHGVGEVVVAVGASNAVIYSINDGETWRLVVGPAAGVTLKTVWCLTDNIWFVGAANGKLFYTLNRGKTWAETALDGDVSAVNDIYFVNDTVGYVAVTTTGGAGRVYRTLSSGSEWFKSAPHIDGLPTSTAVNVVVACNSNFLVAGGSAAAGDGVLAIAQ